MEMMILPWTTETMALEKRDGYLALVGSFVNVLTAAEP